MDLKLSEPVRLSEEESEQLVNVTSAERQKLLPECFLALTIRQTEVITQLLPCEFSESSIISHIRVAPGFHSVLEHQ